MWGSLFLILHPVRPPVLPSFRRQHSLLTHNLLTHSLLTHNLLTHNLLTHTACSHTTCSHTTCSHRTYNLLTHNLHTHTTCSHTTCSHTTCTHNLLTQNLHTHTTYSHTVAGVALAWQAWHLETCSCTLRGKRGTLRHPPSFHVAGVARMALGWLWWRARFPRARVVAAAFCVAGVALGDFHLRFTWQAWHLVTSTFVSRGRRGTRLTHFAWQAWHVWHWAGSGGALGSHVPEWSPRLFAWQVWHLETFIFVSRGKRGTWWHPPSFHVAGVVLDLLTLRGRRGTYGTGLALVARSVPTCPSGRRGFLRGRRGNWRPSSSFHVAGVALGDIHLRFTWQAWYSTCSLCVAGVARMALGWLWWRARFPRARVVAAAFCVAGVALGDIHLRFTWQTWHLVTSTFVSRGRRGTRLTHFAWQAWHIWHWASSGGALGSHVPEWSGDIHLRFTWQAWYSTYSHTTCTHTTYSRRRGTWRHGSSLCVAGVALGDIHLRFTWQAWYSTYSHTTCSHTTYSHATYSRTTCTHTTYSRRRGTWRHGSSLYVAGVARMALGWLWWRVRIFRWIVSSVACCFYRVAQWPVCWLLDGCVVCDFSILGLYVSCGTEVWHVMNSDSNETIATTHHSTLRLDNIQNDSRVSKQHSTIPETLTRCVKKCMHSHVTNSDSNDTWSHLLNLYLFLCSCSCFSLFRSDVSLTSLRLWDSCNEVLAQPSR